ncbi:MAG TPA: MFS transporter [Cyclobacteriaceae bacterium]|nr:MFS transporter [Cyclobacteriaceae bacterium]
MNQEKKGFVLSIIVFSQFCGTSLWFAGNAIIPVVQDIYQWSASSVGHLTSAVQFGFISGTLLYAFFGFSDRFSPSKVFFVSSMLAALANLWCLVELSSFELMLYSRVLTGFFLAGIYPVGMKIAADWNEGGLGNWLGVLVGALVLGTAFPHALSFQSAYINPVILLLIVSALALIGGLLVLLLIKNGPYRKAGTNFSFRAVTQAFRLPAFNAPALGYFGHMWELYAFWAFVPWILLKYQQIHKVDINTSFLAFIIIASGMLGCIVGGIVSIKKGSKWVANVALFSSAACCLLALYMWNMPVFIFITFLCFWGFMVVADSPQFSALIAQNAPAHLRGSAITMSTCIGFAITIVSIQLFNFLQEIISYQYLLSFMSIGPLLGIYALNKNYQTHA